MANILKLVPLILAWETNKYTENLHDRGGATKFGVTVSTWQSCGYDKNHDGHIDKEDVKLLTPEDYHFVLNSFWNSWKADKINNQSVANILVDWVWGSGAWGIKIPQRILGVTQDGLVSNDGETIKAVNNYNQIILFSLIKEARIKFVNDICTSHPDQLVNKQGWLNRINSFKYYV